MNNTFEKARKFVYRNARPLDLRRWQYHFENGKKESILEALEFYQNEDGGFGHALENDSWNPNSSPIQTWAAVSILKKINFSDKKHPIIKGILKYLSSGADFNGNFWYNTVPENDNYPHAQWWKCQKDYNMKISYNPTASLVGFILCHAEKSDRIYKTALKIAKEMSAYYLTEKKPEMHTLYCYIEFYDYCMQSKAVEISAEFKKKLISDVNNLIKDNTSKWENEYWCKPSFFIHSKNSIFYKGNEELCKTECDFIIKNQLESGSWKITWQWVDFENEFAVSANWWQSNSAIENMLFLKEFGGQSR